MDVFEPFYVNAERGKGDAEVRDILFCDCHQLFRPNFFGVVPITLASINQMPEAWATWMI